MHHGSQCLCLSVCLYAYRQNDPFLLPSRRQGDMGWNRYWSLPQWRQGWTWTRLARCCHCAHRTRTDNQRTDSHSPKPAHSPTNCPSPLKTVTTHYHIHTYSVRRVDTPLAAPTQTVARLFNNKNHGPITQPTHTHANPSYLPKVWVNRSRELWSQD